MITELVVLGSVILLNFGIHLHLYRESYRGTIDSECNCTCFEKKIRKINDKNDSSKF
jgi:hypothetical protein